MDLKETKKIDTLRKPDRDSAEPSKEDGLSFGDETAKKVSPPKCHCLPGCVDLPCCT